jgi:hypothetical protein
MDVSRRGPGFLADLRGHGLISGKQLAHPCAEEADQGQASDAAGSHPAVGTSDKSLPGPATSQPKPLWGCPALTVRADNSVRLPS